MKERLAIYLHPNTGERHIVKVISINAYDSNVVDIKYTSKGIIGEFSVSVPIKDVIMGPLVDVLLEKD